MKELNCRSVRKFGVEVELNTLSGQIKKLEKGTAPEGIDYVAGLINKTITKPVSIHGWHNTHNNDNWRVKPDASCGYEVCTPVLKGWYDLKELMEVIDVFQSDPSIKADNKCSLHVHIDVSDLNQGQICNVIAYWIKCELVFMDMVPPNRKRNRYCQLIGNSLKLNHDFHSYGDLIGLVGSQKYYSLNTFHLSKGKRNTIEFRIGENEMCTDSFSVKNWVRLLLYFVDFVSERDFPKKYEPGNYRTGLLWMDPVEVFKFLRFDQPLSKGLEQVKRWMLGRLSKYCLSGDFGLFAPDIRAFSYKEIQELLTSSKQETGFYKPAADEIYSLEYVT